MLLEMLIEMSRGQIYDENVYETSKIEYYNEFT